MTVLVEKIPTDPAYAHLLGRHVEHDPLSKGFPMRLAAPTIDESLWKDKKIRVYDPKPNPNQPVGCCTLCSKSSQLNSAGNRKAGEILDLNWALDAYVWETHNDEIDGAWNRDGSGEDTGSSGLASCKTAQHFGKGGEYRWFFGGAREVVQSVQEGHVVNVGTNWYGSMFNNPYHSGQPLVLSGDVVGGHEWSVIGWLNHRRLAVGICWWGDFREFYIRFEDLDRLLLAEKGDAHFQSRMR